MSSPKCLRRLIYGSTAKVRFSDDDLEKLLAHAREQNAARDITGLLLHAQGSFFQVIEGPPAAIEDLIEIIRNDPRHGSLRVLADDPIETREFAEWSMAYRRLENFDEVLPGFDRLLEVEDDVEFRAQHSAKVAALVSAFRRVTSTF